VGEGKKICAGGEGRYNGGSSAELGKRKKKKELARIHHKGKEKKKRAV